MTELLIAGLAVYRLTLVVTQDTIGAPIRRWAEPDELVSELVTCAWCLSFWIAVLVTLALYATGALVLPLMVWLLLPFAFSAITGILASIV